MRLHNKHPQSLNVLGVILLVTVLIIFAGWLAPNRPKPGQTQTNVERRIGYLETKVKILEEHIRILNKRIDQIEYPTPAATATSRFPSTTSTPSSTTLTVVVSWGNVRSGPGTNYEIIGNVKQGNSLEELERYQNGWRRICCADNGKQGWVASSLVTTPDPKNPTPTPQPTQPTITSPPDSLGVSPIYKKYLNANGIYFLALADVRDRSIIQARDILYGMVEKRPDLLAALARDGLRIILFNDRTTSLSQLPEFKNWDLAEIKTGGYAINGSSHTVAAPERYLRCGRILTHEIGHAIDYAVQQLDSGFATRRNTAFQNAKARRKWIDEYASINEHEYWAVAVEHWFHSEKLAANLTRIDPEAANLVKSVFGETKLQSQSCR